MVLRCKNQIGHASVGIDRVLGNLYLDLEAAGIAQARIETSRVGSKRNNSTYRHMSYTAMPPSLAKTSSFKSSD